MCNKVLKVIVVGVHPLIYFTTSCDSSLETEKSKIFVKKSSLRCEKLHLPVTSL